MAAVIRESHLEANPPLIAGGLSEQQIRLIVIFIRENQAKQKRAAAWPLDLASSREFVSEVHGFKLETVVAGLNDPWSLAFLPTGEMLVSERAGRLRVVKNGMLEPHPIAGMPTVLAHGQGGLLDVAVHPRYTEVGWIYVSYCDGDATGSMINVARGRLREGAFVDKRTLFTMPQDLRRPSTIHFGSRIVFDAAERLYVSVGDHNARDDAQDLTRPNGKIHRMNDDGSIPADNPIIGIVSGLRTIWSFGHRNPQGLSIHPVSGVLWETEQGPRGGDELNRIEGGRNYGWPRITHGMNYDGTAIGVGAATDGMEGPIRQWTPSITVSTMDFYTGNAFPGWKNNLFVGSLTYQDLRRLVVVNDRVEHEEILFRNLGRVRDVVNGPDGYLYVVFNEPDRISRIVPHSVGPLRPRRIP